MNVEQSVISLVSTFRTWAKRFASLGLAVFILLVVARLYGAPTYITLPPAGWELAALIGALAYALWGTSTK